MTTALGATGQFELVHGDILINHQVNSPDYQDLDTILDGAGFVDKELEYLTYLLHEVGDIFKNLPEPALSVPFRTFLDIARMSRR